MTKAMLRKIHLSTLLIGALLWLAATAAPTAAEEASYQWPQWRGPNADGVAPHGDPPAVWSEERNVRFKVEIPGNGLASPIVWGDRIFLLTAIAADAAAYRTARDAAAEKLAQQQWPPEVTPVRQRFVVLALSLLDGSVVWQRTAAEKVPHESHYLDSSWASASPLTDGERLFAHFGSNGLFAYDLDGQLLWQTDLGDMETRNRFGEGSSPALHGDTLIVNWDHEGDSFVVALDAATGAERWRAQRPDEVTSWATPLIVEHAGRAQAIIPATGRSRGYDLATGEEIWSVAGMTVNTIPSPVHRDGLVYLASGYRGNMLQAVSLADARGELSGTPAIRWSHERHTPYVPSLLLYDDRVYFVKHFKNIFSCLDAATGEVLFTEKRLPGISNVYASPVGAAGRVYVLGRDGKAVVLEHNGPGERCEFKVLAENSLDDGFDASPAVVGDEMFLRGRRFLYAIARDEAGGGSSETAAMQGGDLFLSGARIVDPAAREVRLGNLLISNGRIAGNPRQAPADFAGETLELDGRWIIPGLVDLHTHSYGNMAPGNAFDAPGTATIAQRVLYAGVTGFLDLFGGEEALYALRARQRAGEAAGADLFASLSCLTATEGHCTEYGVPTRTMDSPEEARAVVVDLAERNPDVVKIVYAPTGRMPSIDRATLQAAIATASEHGIKTVIHIDTWQDARDAVEAGASAITHVPGGEPVPADLAALMAEVGTRHIPTLAVETDFPHFVRDPDVLSSPLARALATEAVLAAYSSEAVVRHAAERAARAQEREARILESIKTLADAGVVILAGTDAGNYGTLQGFSIHRELLKLVQAGLTPWDALAAATVDAGEFLGRSYGVSVGDAANLVVLDASPIEDIRNTQRIAHVIHHGKVVDREAILKQPES